MMIFWNVGNPDMMETIAHVVCLLATVVQLGLSGLLHPLIGRRLRHLASQ
jgi:hypothetical protein